MKKYTYVKQIPKYKAYRSTPKVILFFQLLSMHRKIGIFLILFGATLVMTSLSSHIQAGSSASSYIASPISINTFLESIQKQNQAIDKVHPLASYVSSSQSTDTSYTTPFFLSFPSLHLSHISVQPNVDSNNATQYETVLSKSTAHFKGTPLPGEGGNTFIYGHSSLTWFHDLYPYSYEGIFTALFDLHIGDTILVNFNDTDYSYIVEGIDTIDANDVSIIRNITGVNTLTLMTCSPPGVGYKRLIVKAVQI